MSIIFPPKVSGFYAGEPPSLISTIQIEQELAVLQGLPVTASWFLFNLEPYHHYSYHLCHIEYGETSYLFFINKYAKIGALSKVHPSASIEGWHIDEELPRNSYDDWKEGTRLLASHWAIVPPDILTLSVDADNPESQRIVSELQNEEFAQFAYWEPQNMGNILFNNWQKNGYWPV